MVRLRKKTNKLMINFRFSSHLFDLHRSIHFTSFISLSLILLQKPSSKLLFGPLGCGSNYNFDSRFMFVCCFFPLYLSFVSSFVICLCIIAIISCVSMCFFALLLFFFKLISAVVSVNVQVKFSRFVFVRSEIELGK